MSWISHDAINVALLVPESVVERAKKANTKLFESGKPIPSDAFTFDDGTHFVHITLVQMYVDVPEDLVLLEEAVEKLMKEVKKIPLRITEIEKGTELGSNVFNPGFKVEDPTGALRDLHVKLVETLKPLAACPRLDEDLRYTFWYENRQADEGLSINEASVEYVRNFLKDKAGADRFSPHAAVGVASEESVRNALMLEEKERQAQEFSLPHEFVADRVAIAHLGNYCTCRKILKEYNLLDNNGDNNNSKQ